MTQVPPQLAHEVVPATHLVDLASEVERQHHLAAEAVCMRA